MLVHYQQFFFYIYQCICSCFNQYFLVFTGSGFEEIFVGVGAGRVRKMFEQAQANAPSIIFIDEIDSIGRILIYVVSI